MCSRLVEGLTVCCAVLTLTCTAAATPVTFSGTVSYGGTYGLADSVYVSVIFVTGDQPNFVNYVAIPRPGMQFSLPYSIGFDNTVASDSLLVVALLDEDHSGFDPDSLDNAITEPDIFGWYDGHSEFTVIDGSTSQTGLDFSLPEGEIHGNVTFASGQTWATVAPEVAPSGVNAKWANLIAPGSYAVIGLYGGDYVVYAHSDVGDLCWGSDPTCSFPQVLTLGPGSSGNGEIRTGVDLDFAALPIAVRSWGRIKAGYR